MITQTELNRRAFGQEAHSDYCEGGPEPDEDLIRKWEKEAEEDFRKHPEKYDTPELPF